MIKVKTGDIELLVHSSGCLFDTDMKPIPVEWEESNYEFITKGKRKIYTHKMVALAFLEQGDNTDIVVHIDGCVGNNDPSNLKYITHEEFCARRSKKHLIRNEATGEEEVISNWSKNKSLYKGYQLVKTFNKDSSVSYSATKPITGQCKNIHCTKDKYPKSSHCKEHMNKFRSIKRSWASIYDSLDYKEEKEVLLDLVSAICNQYGVHDFLQEPVKYNQYDIPTGASITSLDGEVDYKLTDDYGMARYLHEEVFINN